MKTSIIEQEIQIIFPKTGDLIEDQLRDCLDQTIQYFQNKGHSKKKLVKIDCFADCHDNLDKGRLDQLLSTIIDEHFDDFIPNCVIPEKPNHEHKVVLELTILPSVTVDQVEAKSVDNIRYLCIQTDEGKYVIGSGMGELLPVSDIYRQCEMAHEQISKILQNENLNFSNIVRQWNHIEKIVGYTDSNQHYQILNDLRTLYYNRYCFEYGYPAATGIGMFCGGAIINFMAFEARSDTKVISIKSPVQTDAHQYSKKLLENNLLLKEVTKTTPKFERAKVLMDSNMGVIYISGTAAIKGEESAKELNAEQQVSFTLDNIEQLISIKNLNRHNIHNIKEMNLLYYRVYVKNGSDFKSVEKAVEKRVKNAPFLILEADICRPELLVEIEGLYKICL